MATQKIDNKKPSSPTHALSWANTIRVTAILLATAILAGITTYVLYDYTRNLLKERLQERLVAIVATAATQINTEDIEKVHTYDDVEKPEMARLVQQLGAVRAANENIRYAYIMRRTPNPDIVEFVADADSLLSDEELDANGDGEVDDTEAAPWPSDPYEVSDYPVLRDEAFYHPAVDRDLLPDQWGLVMAAYAPIRNDRGETVAILGIDVEVTDFRTQTQETLLPFLLFILFLICLITLLALLLMRMYNQRVEAMQEIDRQKDELLSIVSHQLATPISSAKWYLEMLHDGDFGKLSKEQKEHVKTIQDIAHDLTDLVGMILDVSRIQLDRIQVTRSEVDVGELFDEILAVIQPKAEEQKVDLQVKMPSKLPVANLDRRLTRMTIENLLSNAVKYTPEGGKVKLTASLKDNILTYVVQDTGCGIPKAEQKHMFEKLYRASNVQKVKGNGFGMYIAKGAVEAQGGTINFESAEGKGTTFTVTLPLPSIKESGDKKDS